MLVGCHIVLLCLACRRHLPAGQISSASGQGCLATAGGDVALVACDGAAAWEAQPNGQLKLAGAGSECLSQEGAAAGSEDAALQGAWGWLLIFLSIDRHCNAEAKDPSNHLWHNQGVLLEPRGRQVGRQASS